MTLLAPAHLTTALWLPTGAHPLPDSSVDASPWMKLWTVSHADPGVGGHSTGGSAVMAEEPGALLGPPPPESLCPKGTALPEVPRGGGALVPPSQGIPGAAAPRLLPEAWLPTRGSCTRRKSESPRHSPSLGETGHFCILLELMTSRPPGLCSGP